MNLESLNFTELRDAEIVARMRKCNYEKFKTLVRMHLSFELDLNTDEFDLPCHEIVYEDKGKVKKWNRLSKKFKNGVAAALATGSAGCASVGGSHKSANVVGSHGSNGSPIESLNQQIDPGFLFHLHEIMQFLMLDKNIQQEGIFRKTGSTSRQNELRSQIKNDKPLDLEASGYSAHDCATVFKGYLADLPEPLLTDAHYPAHLQIAPLCVGINSYIDDKLTNAHSVEPTKKELHVLNSIQLLLLLLPDENRQLLQNIIDLLHAVARQHSINKMGPDNLATLFSPHLMCPRNLPPEVLHYLAKKMSSIVAYMIIRGQDIFSVPAKLATDIRAYFMERKRKKTMSPEMALDESISDISTVNTVYTFVDREKTAAAHTTNTTDTELAQLYAFIQSLPESSKKRRLIKQFNKQNGQGTPLQLQAMNRAKNCETYRSSKSISDSIKKHIFHKGIISRTPKRQPISAAALETPNNPSMKTHKQRVLFQSPIRQTFDKNSTTTTTSSVLCSPSNISALTATIINSANNHTSYNIKSHPLQKSISSSSLLMTQQYAMNVSTVPSIVALHREQESSVSSGSSCYNTSITDNLSNSRRSSSDGVTSKPESISGSVNYETPFEFKNDMRDASMTSSLSSTFLVGSSSLKQNFDKNLIGGIEKKSVLFDDNQIVDIEHFHSPSTPKRQTNKNDLKSRYKSEPNLSMSNDVCDTPDLSTAQTSAGFYEQITPIAKHFTGRSLTRKLMKGVSMGNLKFPFSTPESTKRLVRTVSSSLMRRSSEDSNVYMQTKKSYADASMLLQEMNDNDIGSSEGENCSSETETGIAELEDNETEEHITGQTSIHLTADMVEACDSSGSSSELTDCLVKGPKTYQQLLLQESSLYRHNLDLVTSTPSLLLSRRSMSPITKSTQRMPKAMQESIMTPRSRKPVMVLTTTSRSTNNNKNMNRNCDEGIECTKQNVDEQHNNDNEDYEDSSVGIANLNHTDFDIENITKAPPQPEIINEDATTLDGFSDIFKRQELLQSNESFTRQHSIALRLSSDSDSQTSSQNDERNDLNKQDENIVNQDVLTNHFKEYLLTRSVLTEPPEDTSFTSHSDDFNSSHEIEEIDENHLSSSLLYCLDGNRPDPINDLNATTADTHDKSYEDINDTNGDTQTLATFKIAGNSISNGNSNSSTSTYCSNINSSTNRLANNPFVILNNARKRAATQDFDKMSSTLFKSYVDLPTPAITSSYQTDLKSLRPATRKLLNSPNRKLNKTDSFVINTNSSSNKENENYVVTKKLLISEYPGETSL